MYEVQLFVDVFDDSTTLDGDISPKEEEKWKIEKMRLPRHHDAINFCFDSQIPIYGQVL